MRFEIQYRHAPWRSKSTLAAGRLAPGSVSMRFVSGKMIEADSKVDVFPPLISPNHERNSSPPHRSWLPSGFTFTAGSR